MCIVFVLDYKQSAYLPKLVILKQFLLGNHEIKSSQRKVGLQCSCCQFLDLGSFLTDNQSVHLVIDSVNYGCILTKALLS